MKSLDNRNYTELADERKWIQRCVEGDRQAFTVLYTHYAPQLYRVIYPMTNQSKEDTEEIIQELFVKIWDKRDKMLTIRSFRPFIFRMARNRVIDWYRSNEKKKDHSVFYSEFSRDESISLADELLFEEYYAIAMDAIARLPPRQRQIFGLRHSQDLSLEEIAIELKISIHAVKKQLYQATGFIKEFLRKHGEWIIALPFLYIFLT